MIDLMAMIGNGNGNAGGELDEMAVQQDVGEKGAPRKISGLKPKTSRFRGE